MTTDAPLQGRCPNCDTSLQGPFCHFCGQDQRNNKRFFLSLVGESLQDFFAPNSRTARTLFALLFQPGKLTREYFAGRRASYLPPLRLYLVTSITFFFLASVTNQLGTGEFDFTAGEDDEIITAAGKIDPAEPQQGEPGQEEPVHEEPGQGKLEQGEVQVSFLSEEENRKLSVFLDEKIKRATEMASEDPRALTDMAIDLAPPIMFLLVPLFAVLLKLAYLGSGHYYVEHLVLALHNHSFVYLAFLPDLLPASTATGLLSDLVEIWLFIYMFLSLRFTYDEGWGMTIFKTLLLGFSYCLLFAMAGILFVIFGLLSL